MEYSESHRNGKINVKKGILKQTKKWLWFSSYAYYMGRVGDGVVNMEIHFLYSTTAKNRGRCTGVLL